ncbi:adenylate/guanylate cyclase domain-containing protein [Roseibium aggregatum]|uniref:Adenylate/guanylate cyclase domain-containing protein n=1 Tax=Roseibium aggregatum TaxID=187304 RepID=A0A939J430_9HYPH|nr:adenylate/guanylate cyclase domain-containing protein [Roseibium aggregatum]MBN9671202.1 adenylate/guanylate cyclase domain-containing protein [Roseibium aggregatum]
MSVRNKLFITPTLSTVIGSFVLITAAAILIIQVITSNGLIRQLGGEIVDLGLDSAETAIAEQLHAITEAATFTEKAWSRHQLDFNDPDTTLTYLFGAVAPMEQVSFLAMVNAEGNGVFVERGEDDGTLLGNTISLTRDTPTLTPLFEKAAGATDAFWSEEIFIPEREHTYFIYTRPLIEDGDFRGSVLIGMSLYRMSELTLHVSTDDISVFLLKEGSHDMVAHPNLHERFHHLSAENPLLSIGRVPDTFLKDYREMTRLDNVAFDLAEDLDLHEGIDDDGHKRFVILEKKNVNLEGLPVRIGVHFPAEFLEQPFKQLLVAIVTGAGLLVLSLLGAIVLAHRIAQPIKRAALAAKEVAGLNLDAIKPLPASVISEVDDLSTGFNAMVGGLTAFNRYVPKTLVQKLLSEGRADAPPEEREVAVLFSDIVGFTSASEGMSATETAAFVNHHLSLLGAEIARQNGTIDKYIGDSIMAFWGAPERLDNPAEAAARAALGMAAAIRNDNRKRIADGKAPVHIRIGLHMGPLVVGDIGAPERVNYTVIGDTVNAASRLESLGKEIDPDADVIILASREIARNLFADIDWAAIGPHTVKGRNEPLEVVRLVI